MIDDYTQQIHHGDALDLLEDLPAESVHAVVTDPPYGLAFMGRDWDDFEPTEYQEWCEEWATKAKRVLKPGGHLLAFSGNRTHHRLFTGVEDAGFQIRDTLTWHYGSGFPKAADVSKVIDKRGGARVEGIGPIIREHREEMGLSTRELAKHFADEGQEPTGCVWNWENGASNPTLGNFNKLVDVLDLSFEKLEPGDREIVATSDKAEGWFTQGDGYDITEPATDAAKRWDGWKTGLKPATEFVVMARKPFDGATVDCVLEHGTGALNVDGCRIEGEKPARELSCDHDEKGGMYRDNDPTSTLGGGATANGTSGEGRYPANVVFGERAAAHLDASHEDTQAGNGGGGGEGGIWSESVDGKPVGREYGDEGGISRYFYTSKATSAERTLNGRIDNDHPTVKPQDLMEWLVKLVTARGQIVLDPFAGSGTTLAAAKDLGRRFIGVEKQERYVSVSQARVGLDVDDPRVLNTDGSALLSEFVDD